MADILIYDHGMRIGSIIFDEHPTILNAERTATGFNLTIPAKIGLKSASNNEPQLTLKNLRLIFYIKRASNSELEVGRLHDERIYSARVNYRNESPSEELKPLDLTWAATLP